MTTTEVADYLRLKQRKIYELVRNREIPCSRISGKLLFPRRAIDLWVMHHLEGMQSGAGPAPAVVAGSHDPLLEWSLRESGSNLALLCNGSGDGLKRLLDGKAQIAATHLIDSESGDYNVPVNLGLGELRDLVMIEWARRRQGLILAAGNPLAIRSLEDLAGARIAHRQREAGADVLFRYLLELEGVDFATLNLTARPALTESDLAAEIQAGRADCGLGIEAAARAHGLDFILLHEERFDLALRRRDYFEEPVQRLMAFIHTEAFKERALALSGYDVGGAGSVTYNA